MTITKSDILTRASILYKRYGIRNVTMDDISNEMGISKKTLYQYITDKEALIEMVLTEEYNQLDELLGKALKTFKHPIEQFIEIQFTILNNLLVQSGVLGFDLKKYFPEKYHRYFDKYLSLLITILSQNLDNGVRLGIYRQNLDAEHIVKTHVASLLSVIDNDLFKLNEYLSEKHSIESLRYHLRAIVSKKHIDTIDKYLETIKPV
jgi:AcrR family transcriptional regulator